MNRIKNFIEKLNEEISFLQRIQKILIQNFKENFREFELMNLKKKLIEKNLKENDGGFLNLEKYAEEIRKFFDFETETNFLNFDNIINTFSKKLENIKNEMHRILIEKLGMKNISLESNKNIIKNGNSEKSSNSKSVFEDSKLINNDNLNFFINLFDTKKIKSRKILYKAKKENLKPFNFYKNCIDQVNLFFIGKSKRKKKYLVDIYQMD